MTSNRLLLALPKLGEAWMDKVGFFHAAVGAGASSQGPGFADRVRGRANGLFHREPDTDLHNTVAHA